MKNPKIENRDPKQVRSPKSEPGDRRTRSVLDCGGPLPLSMRYENPAPGQSARGLAHSKTWRSVTAFCLLTAGLCLPAFAQNYSIDWHTIDGGGGTSTGGPMMGINYSVSGTIGQPDAGVTMTNGQFAVTGGFWALPTAIQVGGAPLLTIAAATPGQATISWTPPTPGFVLQETWSLSPANWTNSPSGTTNSIAVPITTVPAKFYRLFKP